MLLNLRLFAAVIAASLCLVFPAALPAQEQDGLTELRKLQMLLSVINSEIKSELDQVLLLQEAIKANTRTPLEESGHSPDSVLLVGEVAASQRRAIQREANINSQLDAILARTAELDAKKKQLMDRVRELTSAP